MATHKLATASTTSRLTNQPGRAIVTARGNHFVVDSPASLGGPNEERNPLDLMLGALATCATFICETAAQERGIDLHAITVTAAGDLDARGLCNGEINPRMQAFRVRLALAGPTASEADALVEAFRTRCPVYTTFSRAAPIEIEVALE
jgi:uncharacterized OsmC-like protein